MSKNLINNDAQIEDSMWVYGIDTFDDGTQIPWMQLKLDANDSSVLEVELLKTSENKFSWERK